MAHARRIIVHPPGEAQISAAYWEGTDQRMIEIVVFDISMFSGVASIA